MFSKYREKVIMRIIRHSKTLYTLIDESFMTLGLLTYNRRCHLNAVQAVLEERAKEVYLCVCINKQNNDTIVHFINKNNNDEFVDNTLGWRYKEYDYYIVRKINSCEYDNIENILEGMKKELVFNHSNKIMRKLSKIYWDNFI